MIAKDIYEKFNPTKHIGIHRVLLELEKLLSEQAWGFRSLGIFGEVGIGKTTLAKALFRRMSGGYDATRFIIEYNEKIFELLSEEEFEEIPMEKFDLYNQDDDEPRYRRKRFLIALDDVRDAQDVEALLSGFYRFGPGSLLIITSRDRQVLEKCHVNAIFELKGLNDEDALQLFTRCLFGEDVIEEKFLRLSMSAIEFCDGNPSILRSYAEMIKGKKLTEMVFTEKNKLPFCFQATRDSFPITLKQPFCLLMQNSSFRFSSGLKDMCQLNLPSPSLIKPLPTGDQRIVNSDQESVQSLAQQFQRKQLILLKGLACQLNKLWEGYKSFSRLRRIEFGHFKKLVEVEAISEAHNLEEIDLQECTSLERIPVTDQLKHLQVLNLSGCTGIEHFPDNIRTIRELNLEGTGIIEIRCEEKGFSKLAKQQRTATLELTRTA